MADNKPVYRFFKRVFDVVLSVIAIILLIPVYLVIAIIIKCDSRGPVFYKHHRIGKNGKPFKMYKFRSMELDADKKLDELSDEMKKEFEENYKITDDPRITKIGKILRKTSLDELPQFVNVIRGELSLVGPRPIVEAELEKYGENKDKFLSVIPGITGYWQANGRSDVTYERRMELELYYVDNASFWLDIVILFKTVFAVFKRDGAK